MITNEINVYQLEYDELILQTEIVPCRTTASASIQMLPQSPELWLDMQAISMDTSNKNRNNDADNCHTKRATTVEYFVAMTEICVRVYTVS